MTGITSNSTMKIKPIYFKKLKYIYFNTLRFKVAKLNFNTRKLVIYFKVAVRVLGMISQKYKYHHFVQIAA